VPAGFASSDDFVATITTPGSSGYSWSSSGARVAASDRFMLQQSGGAPGLPPGESGRPMTYASVCYPSSATVSGCTAVTVTSGTERAGVDLAIRLSPAFNIAGHLSGPDGPASSFVLHLVAADSADLWSDPDVATAVTAPDGSFMFLGVAPGRYVIQTVRVPRPPAPNPLARGGSAGPAGTGRSGGPPVGPTLWTATPVVVGDADIAGLNVALAIGNTVSGRVEFEGTAERPQPGVLSVYSILVEPADGKPRANAPAARVGSDGRFTTPGYPAGRYFVRALDVLPNWMLKSVTYGGTDISDSPVELGRGDLAGVIVTFTDRVTRVSGTVTRLTKRGRCQRRAVSSRLKNLERGRHHPEIWRARAANAGGEFGFTVFQRANTFWRPSTMRSPPAGRSFGFWRPSRRWPTALRSVSARRSCARSPA
jgi:hypothetical protein